MADYHSRSNNGNNNRNHNHRNNNRNNNRNNYQNNQNNYRNNNHHKGRGQAHGSKKELADLEITLIDKLMDISFCDKKCSNVNDNETKGQIIEYLDSMHDIKLFNKQCTNLNPSMLRNVTYHQHLLSVLTNGNPYILFLTKIDGINCCLYIDTKLKNGFSFPKIHCVKYKFNDELFNDTIFSGELVRDCSRNWFFVMNNILIYKGKNLSKESVIFRYQLMNNVLLKEYTQDSTIEVCHLQIKRLFKYSDIEYILNEFVPELSYPAKGLIFHTFNSKYNDYMYIFTTKLNYTNNFDDIDNKIANDRPELMAKKESCDEYVLDDFITNTSSTSTATTTTNTLTTNESIGLELGKKQIFKVLKTDITDVYYLYCYDKEKNLIKMDYALVPSLSRSRYIKNIFKKENNPAHLLFKCGYSEIFNKWTPMEHQSSFKDNQIFISS